MRVHGLILVLLTACRLPLAERAEPAHSTPALWQAASISTNALLTDWWRQFGSADLNGLVDEALGSSPNLQAAAARVEQSRLRAQLAGAELLPQVNVSLDGSRQQNIFIGLPIPGSSGGVLTSRATTYRLSLATSWELDLWGRIRAGQFAALADGEAVRADLEGARQSLAAQTVKAWTALTEARQQFNLVQTNLVIAQASAQQAQLRFELGVRPALEMRMAQANLELIRAQQEQWSAATATAQRQLELLLGRYPRGAIVGATQWPEPLKPVPAGLPSELLARRPDIVAARLRLLAGDARVVEAKAGLYPQFSLTASTGTTSPELGKLLDNDLKVWALGANLLQPVFNGGRLRTHVELKQAQVAEAVASYRAVVLNAFAEVETALATEGLWAGRESKLAAAILRAQEALRLADDRYTRGLEPLLTVLEAQRRVSDAQAQHVAVRRVRLENRVNFHLALGGGFTVRPAEIISQEAQR